MRVISDDTDAYGNATVVVALEPSEFEELEDALDADVEARFHVDHVTDPGGTHDTWREAASEVVEKSDYSLLVERLAILNPEEVA